MDSYRFRLSAVLLLAATGLLLTAVADHVDRVTTCDNNVWQVHRLYCDRGVINVTNSLYGRSNSLVCAEGKSNKRLANTTCNQQGTMDKVKTRCNGKKSCELGLHAFRTPDPCVGTFKYLQTNFTCLEAITLVTCEGSVAYLYCGMGSVITIYGADYGRRDQTTCSYRRAPRELKNVTCLQPTALVAQMCNGKFSCSVTASNAVFKDPCKGTYKYLEISYACKCNS
ncbi:L-rhamnose-binding lectin SML-like isoform X2 [Hippocampus comes]|uniref:L-rhamnose-binding lectin SML-like isoform X2 n=1 Tax=Hippocampus comes TaxID=109280 RepID=UPI00094F0A6B|nr:PREDICTED: L-rhamnose-binding lectin SML-like isoform X2 [Hippocampus comes]XP_019718508.1 PREDICTED: L-rhamnose-binding lectin SML-like isoform X2 [Hippocampus comes]